MNVKPCLRPLAGRGRCSAADDRVPPEARTNVSVPHEVLQII